MQAVEFAGLIAAKHGQLALSFIALAQWANPTRAQGPEKRRPRRSIGVCA
jgi:hypothetical protein